MLKTNCRARVGGAGGRIIGERNKPAQKQADLIIASAITQVREDGGLDQEGRRRDDVKWLGFADEPTLGNEQKNREQSSSMFQPKSN